MSSPAPGSPRFGENAHKAEKPAGTNVVNNAPVKEKDKFVDRLWAIFWALVLSGAAGAMLIYLYRWALGLL